jgi:hypothetical protein
VLAVALIEVRRGCSDLRGLATLAGALETVESEHLRPLEPPSRRSTRSSTSSSARCPASRARPRSSPRGGRDDLWWIGDVVLLVSSSLPVVVSCCNGVLRPRGASCRASSAIARRRAPGSKDLDAAAAAADDAGPGHQTVEGVADYGGSLDVILDDA